MGPFTVDASGIVGIETNEFGHILYGRIPAVPTTGLPTTPNVYGVGCVIVDGSTAVQWVNAGTTALPVWALYNGFQQITVTPAQIQMLFGGTSVRLLPAPTATQAIVVNDIMLEYIGVGGTAFSGGGSTVRAFYGSAGTNIAAYVGMGTSTFFGTATKIVQGDTAVGALAATNIIPGNGLYMDNTTAAYANGGSASLKVSLWYSIVPVV